MSPTSADTHALPPIVAVGRGRLGSAIARGAEAAGLSLTLAGRDDLAAVCARAEVVLLCVPDGAIADVAEQVAAAAPSLRLIGHTSGATDLTALEAAMADGAAGFSLHPLQTVPDGSTDLVGAPAAFEGTSAEAAAFARDLAQALGMRPFELPIGSRAAYHAAASMASNFLVALEESAAGLLGEAGVDDARELLAPLVLRTAANWAESGGSALTGPIARGDEATVERHLTAIAATSPELEELYRILAERTRELAKERVS